MAYRVGRYAGRHTLYDELDPAVAAARRAFASPVNEDERLAQWALLKEAEDRRVEEIRKRSVQAVEYSELVEATLTSPKCGSQACWCLTNEGPQHSQGYHIQNEMPVNYGHNVHAASTCGGGCGGCSFVCCSPSQACKAPRNTHTEDMHWLDKKNAVHSVKKGELIPHYSKIVQVHMDGKWQTFTPASDMKAAQDACSCVQASKNARHPSEHWESRQSTKFGGFFVAWGKHKKEKKKAKKCKHRSTSCEC